MRLSMWFGRAANRLAQRVPACRHAAARNEIAMSVEAACLDARRRGALASV